MSGSRRGEVVCKTNSKNNGWMATQCDLEVNDAAHLKWIINIKNLKSSNKRVDESKAVAGIECPVIRSKIGVSVTLTSMRTQRDSKQANATTPRVA
jgi:hypothetical protein